MRVELLHNLDPYAEAHRRLRGEPEPIVDHATADASGLFTLDVPERGLFRLRAIAPGHAPSHYELPPLIESIELDRLRLRESAEPIPLRVLDTDGHPIVAPRVSTVVDGDPRNWNASGRPWAIPVWQSSGTIDVYASRSSKATLEISAPGYEVHRIGIARLGESIRLVRRSGAIAHSLVVVDENGNAIAGAMLVDESANPIATTGDDGVASCLLALGETIHVLGADGRYAPWTASEAVEARLVLPPPAAITGVVFGDGGRPIAGAWVGASARLPNYAERAMLTPRAVATDASGRYALPVEPEIEIQVWAAASGHLRDRRETRVTASAPRRKLDFELDASTVVSGTVLDGAGSPVPGAEIRLENRGPNNMATSNDYDSMQTRSRESGKFSIALPPATSFEISSVAPGFAPHRTEIQSGPVGETSTVVIRLEQGSSLAGRAIDESGVPLASVKASLELSRANGTSSFDGEPPRTFTAADDGRFAFDHLVADFYDLTVTAAGLSARRLPGVAVSGAGLDLGDVVLAQGETVTGRVVDEDGGAITGAIVTWSAGKPGDASMRQMAKLFRHEELEEKDGARTDVEGRFTLTDLSAGQAIDLYADAQGYGLKHGGRFVVPTDEEIEIRLSRAGSIAGSVVDRKGDPIEARLSFDRGTRMPGFVTTGERSNVRGETQADGRFIIEDLAPGDWQLEVRAPRYKSHKKTVTLTAGEKTTIDAIVLDREETAEVHGTVVDARGIGVRAVVRWVGAGMREAKTDATGAYLLTAVPVGEGKLSARRIAGGADRIVPVVVVEGDNTVDLVLDGGTIEGRAVDEVGTGVAGVSVTLVAESSAAFTHTGVDGDFVLHDVQPGRYWTMATKQGMTPREQIILDVGPEGESGVEIVMTEGAIITGRILGVPRHELAEVQVMAFGIGEASARVLADGTYRVDGVAPGEWTIAAHTGNFHSVREIVTVEPDQAIATLDLDFSGPQFDVKGRVTGPDGPIRDGVVAIRSTAESPDATPNTSWTDHEGHFAFGPLPPGRYVITVYAGTRTDVPAMMKVLTVEDDVDLVLTTGALP